MGPPSVDAPSYLLNMLHPTWETLKLKIGIICQETQQSIHDHALKIVTTWYLDEKNPCNNFSSSLHLFSSFDTFGLCHIKHICHRSRCRNDLTFKPASATCVQSWAAFCQKLDNCSWGQSVAKGSVLILEHLCTTPNLIFLRTGPT